MEISFIQCSNIKGCFVIPLWFFFALQYFLYVSKLIVFCNKENIFAIPLMLFCLFLKIPRHVNYLAVMINSRNHFSATIETSVFQDLGILSFPVTHNTQQPHQNQEKYNHPVPTWSETRGNSTQGDRIICLATTMSTSHHSFWAIQGWRSDHTGRWNKQTLTSRYSQNETTACNYDSVGSIIKVFARLERNRMVH